MQRQDQQAQKKKKAKKGGQDELYIKVTRDDIKEDETHSLNIIVGLILNTMPEQGESASVIHDRVMFKFIENYFEKLQRLFELHLKYFKFVEEFDLAQFTDPDEVENYLV